MIEFTADRLIRSRNGGVVEHRLDEVLAVVERAVDRDRVHVVVVDGGHLAALDVARASGRVEDHDVDVLAPRTASIAADPVSPLVRADDHHVLVALGEHVLEEPPDELQRDVLERQGRPVEQLLQPLVESSIWTSGATAGWRNVAYASWQIRSNTTRSISPSTNGHITAAATSA